MNRLPNFEVLDAWAARLDSHAERDDIVARELRKMQSEGGKALFETRKREAEIFRAIAKFLTLCSRNANKLPSVLGGQQP